MLPDRVSNPGPLTYESGALPIALHGPIRYEDTWRVNIFSGTMMTLMISNTGSKVH